MTHENRGTGTTVTKVTTEEAQRIAEAYSPHVKHRQDTVGTSRGVVKGSVIHALVPTAPKSAYVRHLVAGRFTSGPNKTHPVAYISLLQDESPADFESVTILGSGVTFSGLAGVIQAQPRQMRDYRDVLFGGEPTYIGFDWMGVPLANQPSAELLIKMLEDLNELMNLPGPEAEGAAS